MDIESVYCINVSHIARKKTKELYTSLIEYAGAAVTPSVTTLTTTGSKISVLEMMTRQISSRKDLTI